MLRSIITIMGLMTLFSADRVSLGQMSMAFVARPGQVVRLVDRNGDADFLDFAEQTVFADALSIALDRLAAHNLQLFVAETLTAEIFVLEDRNGDEDALDFGEVRLFAQIPVSTPAPVPAGLAVDANGVLFVADATGGGLFAFRDLNSDGDALDFAERVVVAEGLTGPTAIAARPDGTLLINQTDATIPVRILEDRNADDDFLDFAENISYAENIPPGEDLAAASNVLGFMMRRATGQIIALRDLNGDGDVLDFSEVLPFAQGLDMPSVLTNDGSGGLLVAAHDAAGTVFRVADLNGDSDALDFGEVAIVAQGLTSPTGIVALSTSPVGCLKGDVNQDAIINVNDVSPCVEILLGNTIPTDSCPVDVNNDGRINGLDIQALVDLLICP